MQTFRPVEIKNYYINRIASGMSKYFLDNMFEPLFDILKDNNILNSKDALIQAIKNGSIYYEKGAFRTTGNFSNSIASTLEAMGAKFRGGAYYIEQSLIPMEYAQALAYARSQALFKLTAVANYLSALDLSNIDLAPYIEAATKEMFKSLQKDIVKSAQEYKVPVIELGIVQPKIDVPLKEVKAIDTYWKEQDKKAKKLSGQIEKARKQGKDVTELKEVLKETREAAYKNAPDITTEVDVIELDEQSAEIANDYVYNMKYWVKNWEAKNIIKMRKDIAEFQKKGVRVPEIQEYFMKRWKIAKDKAYFLAKNESHLAASSIIKTQYEKLGSNRFRWGRSSSKEKRELHKKYYGKVFYFNDPPIIDERLGIKGLPRQIWNCLCHMEIVVPTLDELQAKRKQVQNSKTFLGKLKNAIKIKNSTQRNNNPWRYRRFGQGQTF